MSRRLPPFGQGFVPVPASGVQVAIGPRAWHFARRYWNPIMVLPVGDRPAFYRWPSDGKPALIHERGEMVDSQLDALATELIKAGAPTVVVVRESLLDTDPRVFYDAEVLDAVA